MPMDNTGGTNNQIPEASWICPACGASNNGNFCGNCGAEKPEAMPLTTEAADEQTPTEKGSFLGRNWLILVAAFVLLCLLGYVLPNNSGSGQQALIPYFGQEPVHVWTTLQSLSACELIAEFAMEIPDDPAPDYPVTVYRVFTGEIIEVQYQNDEGVLGMVIAKGILSTSLSGDTTAYRKIETITVDGQDYVFKGNGDSVSMVLWSDGEYNYYVGMQADPVSQERAVEIVSAVK